MKLLLVISLGLLSFTGISQINHFIASASSDSIIIRDLIETGEGDVIAGYDINNSQSGLLRLNGDGTVAWSKDLTIPLSDANCSYEVAETNQGDYILYGLSMEGNIQYAYVTGFDASGTVQFSKKYFLDAGLPFYDIGNMQVADNGDIYLYCWKFEASVILRLDASGNLIWGRSITNDSNFVGKNPGYDFIVLADGSVLGCGKNESKVSLFFIDANGTLVWDRTYGMGFYVQPKSIGFDDDDDIVITADARVDSLDLEHRFLIAHFDGATGDLNWVKQIDGFTPGWELHDMVAENDKIKFASSGINDMNGEVFSRHDVFVLDGDGNFMKGYQSTFYLIGDEYNRISWENNGDYKYGGMDLGVPNGLIVKEPGLKSGCYLDEITTTTSVFSGVQEDLAAIYNVDTLLIGEDANISFNDYALTTSEFCADLAVSALNENVEFSVSPNPSSGLFTLSQSFVGLLQVTNINGQIIQKSEGMIGSIDLSSEEPGMYFYSIQIEGELYKGKMILR